MKKLYLTKITFTTGGIHYEEYRIVSAKNAEAASDKVLKWFPKEYPESTFFSCIPKESI